MRARLRIAAALGCLVAIGLATSVWVLGGATPVDRLARAAIAAVGLVCALPVLRDLLAVLSLLGSDRIALGDHIRVDDPPLEGRVVAVGLRRVVVRTDVAIDVSIPNRRLDAQPIHRVARAADRTGVPVELDVPLDDHADAGLLCNRLFEAAMLSPFAVPGQPAEVVLIASASGRSSVRLRGWVADHGVASRYRGDVLQRLRADQST